MDLIFKGSFISILAKEWEICGMHKIQYSSHRRQLKLTRRFLTLLSSTFWTLDRTDNYFFIFPILIIFEVLRFFSFAKIGIPGVALGVILLNCFEQARICLKGNCNNYWWGVQLFHLVTIWINFTFLFLLLNKEGVRS